MAHLHDIYDSDEHFIIAPAARTISTESTKLVLGWQDHNSERYTFEIPRFVEGHDMLECNEVQIHFDNVSSNRRTANSDYYTVTDLQVSPASDDVVIFSWLISGSATQLVGKLSFSIHFACVSDDGEREYSWHTTTFEGISILKGIHNTKSVIVEHSDAISQITAQIHDALETAHEATDLAQQAAESVLPPLIGSYTDITPAQVKEALRAGRTCVISDSTVYVFSAWFIRSERLYGVYETPVQTAGDGTSFIRKSYLYEKDDGSWQAGSYILQLGNGLPSANEGDTIQFMTRDGRQGWYNVPGLPVPTKADPGKIIHVNADGDGYELVDSDDSGSGINYKIGHGLKIVNGDTLQVDAADAAQQDNTLPITSAAVYQITGNIDALLQQI